MKKTHVIPFALSYFQDIESDVAEESDEKRHQQMTLIPVVIWISSSLWLLKVIHLNDSTCDTSGHVVLNAA